MRKASSRMSTQKSDEAKFPNPPSKSHLLLPLHGIITVIVFAAVSTSVWAQSPAFSKILHQEFVEHAFLSSIRACPLAQ